MLSEFTKDVQRDGITDVSRLLKDPGTIGNPLCNPRDPSQNLSIYITLEVLRTFRSFILILSVLDDWSGSVGWLMLDATVWECVALVVHLPAWVWTYCIVEHSWDGAATVMIDVDWPIAYWSGPCFVFLLIIHNHSCSELSMMNWQWQSIIKDHPLTLSINDGHLSNLIGKTFMKSYHCQAKPSTARIARLLPCHLWLASGSPLCSRFYRPWTVKIWRSMYKVSSYQLVVVFDCDWLWL